MKYFLLLTFLLSATSCSSLPKAYYEEYTRAAESGKCNVHHFQMKEETVPIIYGLIIEEPGVGPNYKTRLKQFPFAEKSALGGCVIMKDSPSEKTIFVCPQCLDKQQEWIRSHPRDPWAKAMLSQNKSA